MERDLCPVLKKESNLNIEALKPQDEKKDGKLPKNVISMADQELYKITGIRVKGHPLVKEPFQRDAWNVLSSKY